MKLLLATLHAKYVHASLALPLLAASCADLGGVTVVIREYTVNERVETLLRHVVAEEADVAAFSCYIWNIEATLKLVADLKLVKPGIFVILGGPEVSHGSHGLLAAAPFVDCIVRGEGEETLRALVRVLTDCSGHPAPEELLVSIDGISFRSGEEIITTPERRPVPELDRLPSPFSAGLVDISKPLVYLETSRGCPFSCAFCISSLESGVRSFSGARIEQELAMLMDAGVHTIKLVDRTFNFDPHRANRIWTFILGHNKTSLFHFEIAADLLTDDNIRLLGEVPPGVFRFEIGVQSAHGETLATVGRKSDLDRLFANIRRLKEETGIVLHLDLVAGLPGEDFTGFVGSLDSLLTAAPHHIQVEPLKVLKGTRMQRLARENGYAWSQAPPYRILSNPWLGYDEICRIENASRAIELFYNSGRFTATMETIAGNTPLAPLFTDPAMAALLTGSGRNRIQALFQPLLVFLTDRLPPATIPRVTDAIRFDYCRAGYPGQALPEFLAGTAGDKGSPVLPAPFGELAARLPLPKGGRCKTFTATFARNYTTSLREKAETRITFIYAGNGTGEAIHLLAEPLHAT